MHQQLTVLKGARPVDHIVEAQENERARIARALHDGVGQKIAVLQMTVTRIAGELPIEARKSLREVEGQISEIASELHAISDELYPARLRLLGVAKAIAALCRQTSEQSRIDISFEGDSTMTDIGPGESLRLYRIAQEALHNIEHSRASHATVRLVRRSAGFALTVTMLAIAALALPAVLAGADQIKAPSGGQTSTVAVEGTIEAVSPEGDSLSVRTTDGTTQLFRLLEKVFVHGDGPQELLGLRQGTPVVIHYSGSGASATVQEVDRIDSQGLRITEGVVTSINRDRGEINVRFDNKTTETFKLTNRAAKDVGRDLNKADHPRVIVYYTTDRGVKEAHYFRKK
jgi:hypothetical protein